MSKRGKLIDYACKAEECIGTDELERAAAHIKKYPECTKLKMIASKSQAIGDFLDWLVDEKGISLCERHKVDGHYYATPRRLDLVMAEYFNIDLNKVENEKRQMIEELRNGR